jgi:hypothetical protein
MQSKLIQSIVLAGVFAVTCISAKASEDDWPEIT